MEIAPGVTAEEVPTEPGNPPVFRIHLDPGAAAAFDDTDPWLSLVYVEEGTVTFTIAAPVCVTRGGLRTNRPNPSWRPSSSRQGREIISSLQQTRRQSCAMTGRAPRPYWWEASSHVEPAWTPPRPPARQHQEGSRARTRLMSGGRVRVGTWESSEIQRGLEALPVRVVSFPLLDLDRRVLYFGVCPQQYLDFIDDLHRVGHHRELPAVNIPSRALFNEGRAGSDCIPYHDEYCHTGSHAPNR
jgi:hypothetical protein